MPVRNENQKEGKASLEACGLERVLDQITAPLGMGRTTTMCVDT